MHMTIYAGTQELEPICHKGHKAPLNLAELISIARYTIRQYIGKTVDYHIWIENDLFRGDGFFILNISCASFETFRRFNIGAAIMDITPDDMSAADIQMEEPETNNR